MFKLVYDKVFYGPTIYDLHIEASHPGIVNLTKEEFSNPEVQEMIIEAIASCIGSASFKGIASTIVFNIRPEVSFRSETNNKDVFIPEALIARGNGFHLVWEVVN